MKRMLSLTICVVLMLTLMSQTAFAAAPDSKLMVTPYDLTVTQIMTDDENPYGGVVLHFKMDNIPDPFAEGNHSDAYWLDFERKIGDGGWEQFGSNPLSSFAGEGNGYEAPNKYVATETWGEEAKNEARSYRVRMMIYDTVAVSAATPWSNVATVGIKASSWASADIQKALDYGLVPESIKSDYTKPITREEFAELSVKLYEVYTGNKAEPATSSTFTDTQNSEIFKANKLGIVSGVGNNKFDPKALTNREQIAAMLNRAVKVIAPEADLSTAGAPSFVDEKSIAPYFVENVKFMSKNSFIKGSNGSFDPKGTCTREMAVLIAVRVYEYYKISS